MKGSYLIKPFSRFLRRTNTIAAVCLLIGSPVFADTDHVRSARLGFAAWECAISASMMEGGDAENARLFDLGLFELTRLVNAFRDDQITEEQENEMPVGILWNLTGGPSTDFVLGFLFAQMQMTVYDDLSAGYDTLQANERSAMLAKDARLKFIDDNCELLR